MGILHLVSGSMCRLVGLIVAFLGLLVIAAILYELISHRAWIARHIPSRSCTGSPSQG